jgi:hypothetical protein
MIKLLRINQLQHLYPRIWCGYLLAESRESMDLMISRIIDRICGINEKVTKIRQSISDHTGIKLTELAQSIFDVQWTCEDREFVLLRERINSLEDRRKFFLLVKATLEAAQDLRGDIEKIDATEKGKKKVVRGETADAECKTIFDGNLWENIFGTDDQKWKREQRMGMDGLVIFE